MNLALPVAAVLFVLGAVAALIGDHSHRAEGVGGDRRSRVARYSEDSDALFGVAPWLPALYFAFGVVVALLAEIATSSVEFAVKAVCTSKPRPVCRITVK